MRFLLLLTLLLTACDTVEPETASTVPHVITLEETPITHLFIELGSSNAAILFNRHQQDFERAFVNEHGYRLDWRSSAIGGTFLVKARDPENIVWNPDSTDELFDHSLSHLRLALEYADANNIPADFGGWFWTHGNDLGDTTLSGVTPELYFATLDRLIDAYREASPEGSHFYLMEAATKVSVPADQQWQLAEWRQWERSVCEENGPYCRVLVSGLTEQFYANWQACTTIECRRRWFVGDVHWGPESSYRIVATMQDNLATYLNLD